jgi:DNA-binding NarL/FixJ family response regulator
MSTSIALVLAEGYPILLEGLEQVFRSEPGFHVLSSCTHGDEALRAVTRHRPDILVLDLEISGNAFDILENVAAAHLPTRVVLYAARVDAGEMLEAIRLGTKGVVLKSMGRHHLIQCIRKVHEGATWLERSSANRAVEQHLRREDEYREASTVMSARQLEVVRMVLAGRSNREIADTLAISEGTVKGHLHQVYERLNIRNRLELALYAHDRGLFAVDSGKPRRPSKKPHRPAFEHW